MILNDSILLAATEAAHATHHEVSFSVTALFTALLVGMILCLALEETLHAKKSLIVGLFAVACLFLAMVFHLEPGSVAVHVMGETLTVPIYIPAIDWGVIAIILGSSIFVDVTSKSGLFTWIAIRLTKMSRGDPRRLLWFYGVMTVVFSAVLNNVTAMIIVGSLTGVSLKKLRRESLMLGFLLVEGLLTNIGGLLTLISSVPNIIVGTAAKISFIAFLTTAAPFVVIATSATLYMGARLFAIPRLVTAEEQAQAREQVGGFDENDGIESDGFFRFGAIMLGLFILAIATTSIIPYIKELGMGYVALLFAALMLIRYKSSVDTYYRAIDWDLLGFFAALFVVINVMEHAQVLALIGSGLQRIIADPSNPAMVGWGDGTGLLLILSAVASSVTDNIPLAAMLAKILGGLGAPSTSALWWAVVFGANLGGNLTPIGSASTLVAVTIIHKNGIKLSFAGFVTKALPYAVLHLAIASAYVLLLLR